MYPCRLKLISDGIVVCSKRIRHDFYILNKERLDTASN